MAKKGDSFILSKELQAEAERVFGAESVGEVVMRTLFDKMVENKQEARRVWEKIRIYVEKKYPDAEIDFERQPMRYNFLTKSIFRSE